jgi:cytochrome P450
MQEKPVNADLNSTGSDTTALSPTTIFSLLMKHPENSDKLLKELDSAFSSGVFIDPLSVVVQQHKTRD